MVANQLGKALDEGNDFLPTYHYYQSPSLEKKKPPQIYSVWIAIHWGLVLENINTKINSILCSRSFTLTPFTSCGMWAGTTVSDVGWDDGFGCGLGRRFRSWDDGFDPGTTVWESPKDDGFNETLTF